MNRQRKKKGDIMIIYLAGGCFWGLQKYLQSIPGVIDTEVGYANGTTKTPSYDDVCYNSTGHAETVKVKYDPAKITLSYLLKLYFRAIDPTALNRQGNDIGSQYRTGIYYVQDEDEHMIRQAVDKLRKDCKKPVVIEIKPLQNYYPAESCHQDYLTNNPQGYCHIGTKLFKKAENSIVDPEQYVRCDPSSAKKNLNKMQYRTAFENATEPPYENEYWNLFIPGIYVDITTGEPLFSSLDKFMACGWPSFSKPLDPDCVTLHTDLSQGMKRVEVRSRTGDIHLGHVFHDGPGEKGGLRYCINSSSLRFIPKEDMKNQGYSKYLPFV